MEASIWQIMAMEASTSWPKDDLLGRGFSFPQEYWDGMAGTRSDPRPTAESIVFLNFREVEEPGESFQRHAQF